MAFTYIPEDGSGLTTANAYYSLEDIEAEMENIVSDEWDKLEDEDKKLLSVKVTNFFEERFRWYGEIFKSGQSLQWPRTKNYDSKGEIIPAGTMPKQLLVAFTLMCREASEDEELLDFDTLDRAGELKSWSTDGLDVSFGSTSGSGQGSSRGKDKATEGQIYGTKFTQIEVLVRSIGEIKNLDWISSNRQTVVR